MYFDYEGKLMKGTGQCFSSDNASIHGTYPFWVGGDGLGGRLFFLIFLCLNLICYINANNL